MIQGPRAVRRDESNPFPWYQAMRASAPVFYDERQETWHVFRYVDVQRVLSEYTSFSSSFAANGGHEGQSPLGSSIIGLDPPRHRQLRALVSQAFTPRAIEALAPRIAEIVGSLLDQVAPTGQMDVIHDFAYPLPVIVIAELMGIPAAERDRFKSWSDAVVTGMSSGVGSAPSVTAGQAHREMAEYFGRMIEERRRQPKDDLISALLQAQVEGQHLTQMEVLGFCILLLIAGNETTTNLIGNAVLCFEEYPEAMEAVRADRSLLPSALEEVLRYRSPVQSMFRTVAQETTLGEGQTKKGQRVIAWIGSANHDETMFEAPERFDPRRTPNRHIAFGYGVHFCLGAPLARLEARIALDALLRRLPDLHLVPGATPTFMESPIVYGAKHLPFTFTPSA